MLTEDTSETVRNDGAKGGADTEAETFTADDEPIDSDSDDENTFCEVCDKYFETVKWFETPFVHKGRSLYSACEGCQGMWSIDSDSDDNLLGRLYDRVSTPLA